MLGILLPLWLVCFGLHVREAVRNGGAVAPVFATPVSGDDYPHVGGLRPESYIPDPGLRVGDRLLKVGAIDLRGAGHVGFYAAVHDQAGFALVVPVVFERAGERGELDLALSPSPLPWVRVPGLIAIAVTCLIVLLRAPQRRQARRFYTAFMAFLILETPFDGSSYAQTVASQLVFLLSGGIAAALVLHWALGFPEEVEAPGRIPPVWAFAVAPLWYAGRLNYLLGAPLPPPLLPSVTFGVDVLIAAAFLCALTWNYRRAAPVGRRRIKWVLYGAYLGTASLAATILTSLVSPESPWVPPLYWASALAMPLLPAATLVAIARYNLFDIDRLISATLSYNIVLVILSGIGLVAVPSISQAASAAIGLDPVAGRLILSLGLAAIVVPAQRRLRPQIDRVFFADSHRLERGVEDLIGELSSAVDARDLVRIAGARLDELLQPELCLAYLRAGAEYRPVFARGREEPGALESDGPLIAVLRRHKAPVTLEHAAPPRALADLSAFDRVALETLGAALVLPLRSAGDFEGFVALGRKRSSDVYTSTDLALLAAIADRISSRLPRLRDEEIPEGAGEIATILFSDLVGSTTLMQRVGDERAQQLFQAHHLRLQREIARAGGRELQWLGDGLMASFASTADAVRCAIAMQQAAAQPIDGEALRIRVGLNVGEILRQTSGAGYFGLPVVTARRLCDRAEADQILCSDTVAGLLSGRQAFRFRDLGRWELKGVSTPIGVYEVLR